MKKTIFIFVFFVLSIFNTVADGIISNVTNITTPPVLMYSKFEIGISLTKSFTNPYDPDIISVEATFFSPTGKQYKVYGFYYVPYNRITTSPFWTTSSTNLPWRVRFAPNEIGTWYYSIKTFENGTRTGTSNLVLFNCIASNNHGYLKVSPNNRYLEFSDKTSFLGIAEDLRAFSNTSPAFPPDCPTQNNGWASNILCTNWCYNQNTLTKHFDWINDFSVNGGNFVRIWLEPYSYDIEWENINNYGNRQNRASDLDLLFEYATQKSTYIHLVLFNEQSVKIQNTNEGASWQTNPYKNTLSLNTPIDFFESSAAKNIYKKRLRYIISRWGYSTAIASYCLINEPEFIGSNSNGTKEVKNYWDNTTTVNNWLLEMAQYIKNSSYNPHLLSVDYAWGFTNNANYTVVNNNPLIDFTNCHYYSNDVNANYQWSYILNHHFFVFQKPTTITEYSHDLNAINCWISEDRETDIHNAIWSTGLSGHFSTNFYYSADSKYNNPCYGQGACKYKPFSKFIEGETFNSTNHTFLPAGNAQSVYSSYNNLQYNRPPNAPNFDQAGFAARSNFLDYTNNQINTSLLSQNITTNDNQNIQVFAIKNQNRVLGWVHNKNYYWYNVPHSSDNGQAGNNCNTLYGNSPNTSNYPNNIQQLTNKTITISNLICNGQYKIEWFSTQCNYDINNDGIPDNGGVIQSLTTYQNAVNGIITINIPKLQPIELNQKPFAPDYGFKVIYQSNNGFFNGNWKHEYTGNYSDNNQVSGNITINTFNNNNQIFYRGSDGYLHHFYWNSNTSQWIHDGLVTSYWTQPTAHQVAVGGSIAVNTNDQVFYKGNDGRMQHYWWDGSQWRHEYTGNYNDNNQVTGNITINTFNNNNQIFYKGSDGYLHHFYWNNNTSQWVHDWLVSNYWTQPTAYKVAINSPIVVNSLGYVFYKGNDGRMQHYWWDGNQWKHEYTGEYEDNNQVSGSIAVNTFNNNNQVFYRGGDGFLHHFYWNNNTSEWIHDGLVSNYWTQPTAYKVALDGMIAINTNGQVFYKGNDGRMQHYWWDGSQWRHEYTGEYADNNQVNSQIIINTFDNNNQIFYKGNDGYLHHFYWNNNTSKWIHDGLVPNYWTQPTAHQVAVSGPIAGNSLGYVFYKGTDGQMQHYWWDNPCEHFGSGRTGIHPQEKDTTTPLFSTIESKTRNPFFDIFPNPTDSELNIKFHIIKDNSIVSLKILNENGFEIYSLNNKSYNIGQFIEKINVSNLPNGLYLITIICDNKISTSKIVINHR